MPLPDEDQHQDPIPPEFETGVSAGSTYNNTFTTSWSVVALDKKSIGVTTSVVVSGVIQVSASSADGYEADFKQRVDFDVSGGISTNFISYENLTNDDVVTWIRREINNVGVFKILDEGIDCAKEQYTTVKYQDLPWNS